MERFLDVLKGLDAAALLVAVMVIAHVFQRRGVLTAVYAWTARRLGSRKLLLTLVAALLGLLPIPGRISVASSVLETLQKPGEKEPRFGIIAYLAAHHYYLWSPMEKSVVIALGGLGLSYAEFLGMMAWPLVVVLAVCFGYIALFISEEDIALAAGGDAAPSPRGHLLDAGLFVAGFVAAGVGLNVALVFGGLAVFYVARHRVPWREALGHVNWKLVAVVVGVVLFAAALRVYADEMRQALEAFVKGHGLTPVYAGALTFTLSLILGSSSRYSAVAVVATLIYGMDTFVFFFLVDYAGYLLSPTHKCVWIGKMYFDTPLGRYYRVIGLVALLMIGYGLATLGLGLEAQV